MKGAPDGGNQNEDNPASTDRGNSAEGERNPTNVEGVHVQLQDLSVGENVVRVTSERVTSTRSGTKEDLVLLKRNNPLGYLNAILEGREISSDQIHDASTASGKSTSTSPLEEALQKVKAQLFKRDLC